MPWRTSGSPSFSGGVYVGTDYNSASMLDISPSTGDQYTGTMYAKNAGQAAWSLEITSVIVTGSRINISLRGSLGASTSLTGTIQGHDLHLQVPQDGGQLEDYVFHPGTSAEYNSDLLNFP